MIDRLLYCYAVAVLWALGAKRFDNDHRHSKPDKESRDG